MASLGETELIHSLLKQTAYLEQIVEEMIPDDTMDLVQGSRRGKSDVKALDHIVGVSDLASRQKAKQLRERAVTQGKSAQLKRCMIALGVYLRKFVLENIEKENYGVETSFGRFIIVEDPMADPDSLYTKKVVYEAAGLLG